MTMPIPTITRRRILVDSLLGTGAMGLLSATSHAAPGATSAPSGAPLPTGDVRDFDFLVGRWNLVNRRLKKRWVGSDDWDVFPGKLRCESLIDGVVNWDEAYFPTRGFSGVTMRVFNPTRRQWSLYWINGKSGELFPPVVGGFAGDRGEFYGDDTDEGRPIKVVFRWTRIDPDTARWEQAFSTDGRQWETNWIIEHSRAKA